MKKITIELEVEEEKINSFTKRRITSIKVDGEEQASTGKKLTEFGELITEWRILDKDSTIGPSYDISLRQTDEYDDDTWMDYEEDETAE